VDKISSAVKLPIEERARERKRRKRKKDFFHGNSTLALAVCTPRAPHVLVIRTATSES